MQIIDRLEVNRRGPYGGGIGHVSFTGSMDMALGLRTMVIPTTRCGRGRCTAYVLLMYGWFTILRDRAAPPPHLVSHGMQAPTKHCFPAASATSTPNAST